MLEHLHQAGMGSHQSCSHLLTQYSSPSKEVRILAQVVSRDIRSTTAKNIRLVEIKTGGLSWSAPAWKVREETKKREVCVPDVDSWRFKYLDKLLEERDKLVYEGVDGSQEMENVQELIDSLLSS